MPSTHRPYLTLAKVALAFTLAAPVFVSLLSPSSAASSAYSYPLGVPDSTSPSGYAPPPPSALPGYSQTYVQDFTGSSLPPEWDAYSGQPGGDPGAQFGSSHVTVSGGLLVETAYKDPAYNNEWVTGGACQCGDEPAQAYGAWFVRSRVTGPGPTSVELLWPNTNAWPPEIDFNESGGNTTGSTSTVHFFANNSIEQHSVTIDLTKWHTWGVIWTPSSITYTVDGRYWAANTKPSEIPSVPMHLSVQQQTFCGASPAWACPAAHPTPQSTLVDWVTEYSPIASSTTTLPPTIPGTPTLRTLGITRSRAGLTWADSGTVTALTVRLYTHRGCTSPVRTQSLPNAKNPLSSHRIYFLGPFSAKRSYYARVTAVSGPAAPGPTSACVRIGTG